MVRGIALLSCVVGVACLEPPGRGAGDEVADPGDDPGGDDPGGGADAGGPAPAADCGASAEIAYSSAFTIGTGTGHLDVDGLALIVNTGSRPLDLSSIQASVGAVAPTSVELAVMVEAGGGELPAGQAHGVLNPFNQDDVLAQVNEPWTEEYNPQVNLRLDYIDTLSFGATIVLTFDELRASVPLYFTTAEGASSAPTGALRVAAECAPVE
ncbi:MAG TPA: hypothetical protein VMZ28_24875 [Kofleriaceae bacterium]|nr:hypothetical protein [Kofleriaceae bacterium]